MKILLFTSFLLTGLGFSQSSQADVVSDAVRACANAYNTTQCTADYLQQNDRTDELFDASNKAVEDMFMEAASKAAEQEITLSFHNSCNDGDENACRELGVKYLHGNGVTKNYGKALDYFSIGCMRGKIKDICNEYANMYHHGQGVPKDDATAHKYYALACAASNPRGCRNKAWGYETGSGVVKDKVRAAKIYQHACEIGAIRACRYYGLLLDAGIVKNTKTPREFFEIDCAKGDEVACNLIE